MRQADATRGRFGQCKQKGNRPAYSGPLADCSPTDCQNKSSQKENFRVVFCPLESLIGTLLEWKFKIVFFSDVRLG